MLASQGYERQLLEVNSSYRPPEHPRREPSFPRTSTAALGFNIALASFSMLFGASLVGYFITRGQSDNWHPTGSFELPSGLWVSSGLLITLSLVFRSADAALTRNNLDHFQRGLRVTLLLALLFLMAQTANWVSWIERSTPGALKNLYTYNFFLLTGLHALHVLGGLWPLAVVNYKAKQGQYSSSRREGVSLTRRYWDFLLLVWLVMAISLSLFR